MADRIWIESSDFVWNYGKVPALENYADGTVMWDETKQNYLCITNSQLMYVEGSENLEAAKRAVELMVILMLITMKRGKALRGKIKTVDGELIKWVLAPGDNVIIEYLGKTQALNAEGITHQDQVVRIIDNIVATVREWQYGNDEWHKYGGK